MNRKLTNWTLGIGTPLLLIAAWGVSSQGSTNTFFPPLGMILERFQALWLFDHFGSDVMLSLRNLVIGYALATVIGVGLGFVTALVPVVRWALDPADPFLPRYPAGGAGADLHLADRVRDRNATGQHHAGGRVPHPDRHRGRHPRRGPHAQGRQPGLPAHPHRKAGQVYLPAAGPQIASGMQVSLQVAFIVMIASEMLGSSQGIGAMTLLAQQSFMTSDMWAGILLLGVVGFGANLVFDVIKNKVLAWYVGSRRLARS